VKGKPSAARRVDIDDAADRVAATNEGIAGRASPDRRCGIEADLPVEIVPVITGNSGSHSVYSKLSFAVHVSRLAHDGGAGSRPSAASPPGFP